MVGKRKRKSSIDLLPDEIQAKIIELSKRHTIDEILEHLKQLDVDISRSALGRHIQKLPEIIDRMNRSRIVAEALVKEFGEKGNDKIARANIEMGHTLAMEIMTKCEVDPETGEIKPVTFEPMELMLIGKAFDHFASAKKKDAETTIKVRDEITKQAMQNVTTTAKGLGLSAETVATLRASIGTGMFNGGADAK